MSDEHGTAATDSDASPDARVGHYVRRRDLRYPWHYTPWAQISMTVPAPSGLCWLVCFIDGEVDVWRADDSAAGYQFRLPETGAQSK